MAFANCKSATKMEMLSYHFNLRAAFLVESGFLLGGFILLFGSRLSLTLMIAVYIFSFGYVLWVKSMNLKSLSRKANYEKETFS